MVVPPCIGSGVGQTFYSGGFIKNWGCQPIRVTGPAGADGAIDTAIGSWNSGLKSELLPGLPKFLRVGTTPDVTITVSGNGPSYCGSTPNRNTITITSYSASTPSSCPTNWGPLTNVLVHQLSHVLGFQGNLHQANSIPVNCAVHLNDDHTINGGPCQHELEYVFAAYGYTSFDVANLWNRGIVTRLVVAPTSLALERGATARDSVTALLLERQLAAPSSYTPSFGSFQWSSSSQAATLSPSNTSKTTVTGFEFGTAVLRARLTGTSVTNALVGTIVRLVGDSVTVVVAGGPPPPPPGSGFRVSGISGPATPITTSSDYTLIASVTGQPGSDLSTQWQVTYSNGIAGPFDTKFTTGSSYVLTVPPGSYTITVTVTPKSAGIVGSPLTQNYPVCTSSPDGPLGASLSESAVPDESAPDAVGGC